MDQLMDARALAGALVRVVRMVHSYRGTAVAVALLHDALNVLSDEDVETELQGASVMLPQDVVMALERDNRELAAALTHKV
jgi:hypothetical protein